MPMTTTTTNDNSVRKSILLDHFLVSFPAKKLYAHGLTYSCCRFLCFKGGTAGAVAMGANVACLMWMRTTVNYQYRNGGTFVGALSTLYADGGIPRFYRGVIPALIQGPLSRFGDTAANTGVLTLLNHVEATKDLNVGIKTACASLGAALFRIFLMPVDTVKVGLIAITL
jgi:hypothetical protein